jgi:lysophospholipase L1-like esterase
MKKILVLALALAALCVSAQAQKVVHLNRYAEANAALEAPSGPRVVLYGDSITDGWASQRPEFFAATGFIGRGISGEETAQMLLRFRADVIDIGASAMVFLGGINDIAQNMGDPYKEDVTYANILSMIDLCWQNGIRPVICSLLPSYHIRWRTEVTDSFEKVCSLNARLKAYCERHGVTYVDYVSVLAGEDGRILEAYSGDTVHPNAAGYALMEKLLLETL